MNPLTPIFVAIFAARVSNRLIDLGVDVLKMERLEPSLKKILYEVERDKRGEFNAHEAAAYFFCAAFSNIHTNCYMRSISKSDMAKQAWKVISQWQLEGKIRPKLFNVLQGMI